MFGVIVVDYGIKWFDLFFGFGGVDVLVEDVVELIYEGFCGVGEVCLKGGCIVGGVV